MKRILLATLVAAGLSLVTAHAQRIRWGVKAGPSLTTFVRANDDQYTPTFNLHVGGLAEIALNDLLFIQPELLFSAKGAKAQSFAPDFYPTQFKTTLRYIDLPILLKVKRKRWFFEVGPQVGIDVATRIQTKGNGSIPRDDSYGVAESGKFFHAVDFGYAAGIGYAARNGLLVGLRYNGGLRDVYKIKYSDQTYNSVSQLYVGYLFNGK